MKTTTQRQATGRKVRRRRRWAAVGVTAAVMALSGCTLDFSDGKIQVMCWLDDYEVWVDYGGDYHFNVKTLGCPQLGATKYYPPSLPWPVEGPVLWSAT